MADQARGNEDLDWVVMLPQGPFGQHSSESCIDEIVETDLERRCEIMSGGRPGAFHPIEQSPLDVDSRCSVQTVFAAEVMVERPDRDTGRVGDLVHADSVEATAAELDQRDLHKIYARADDLTTTVRFYRDTLGWSEAWREGDDTVAFHIPGSDAQVMVSTTDQPAGPMLLVDRVEDFLDRTSGLTVTIGPYGIPDGTVVGFEDPSGNTIYVFDQARA